jgi:hypothetical protein
MPMFKVCYTESVVKEIDIEAESAEEAERIVDDGGADYDAAVESDAEIVCIDSVEEIERCQKNQEKSTKN